MSNQESAVEITSIVACTFSSIADIFILVMYYRHKKLHTLAFTFVRNIAIADFAQAFSATWGASFKTGEFFCSLQGYLNTFGGVSSFIWVTIVAICMYSIMYHTTIWEDVENVQKIKKILPIIGFVFPAIWSLLPFTTGSYGNVGGWCWIEQDTHSMGPVWRWLLYYGLLIFVFFLILAIYGTIMYKMKQSEKEQRKNSGFDATTNDKNNDNNDNNNGRSDSPEPNRQRMTSVEISQKQRKKLFNRIKWYPFALIFGWTFAVLNRFLQLFGDTPFWLQYCHALFSGLYGLTNAIIYGLTPTVTVLVKQDLQKFPCIKSDENNGRVDTTRSDVTNTQY